MRDVPLPGTKPKRKFVESHAPLYVDVADLRDILRRASRRGRDLRGSSAVVEGNLLDDSEPPPSLDVADLQAKYDHKLSGERAGSTNGRFSDAGQHVTMLFVEAEEFTTGAEQARALLNRVRGDIAALGGPGGYAPGMKLGFCSDIAISVEELDALEADLSLSSILVFIAEIIVIVLYYRWWSSILVLFPPLLLATAYAFAIASLPPGNVTALNSNTAFLGSIIVGNGINVGIVLLARYREARHAGASVDEALVTGVWGARLSGTLAASSLARGSVSYASLIVTEFRGFRQFGYIGGAGMVASWITAFVLMPPLIKWIDRDPPAAPVDPRVTHPSSWGWSPRSSNDGPVPVALVAVALTSRVGRRRLPLRPLHPDRIRPLQASPRRHVDVRRRLPGARKPMSSSGGTSRPTWWSCPGLRPARSAAAERIIRDSADHGPLQPMVASVRGVDDCPPRGARTRSLPWSTRSARRSTPKIRSLLDENRRKDLDKFLGPEGLAPVGIRDLPRSFTTGLRERDGSVGRTVLAYPRPSDALWRAKEIDTFVRSLRDAATAGLSPGETAGPASPARIPLSGDIIASIGRDAPLASLISFAGVVAVVVIILRARLASLYVIGSLVVGLLWLAGATLLFHIKLNFCNFVAYPITVGIGVDYSVNVISRFVQDGSRDVTGAVRSTGAAVGLCSLTTTIGYSSLLLAKNRALFLFGLTRRARRSRVPDGGRRGLAGGLARRAGARAVRLGDGSGGWNRGRRAGRRASDGGSSGRIQP